MESEKQLLRQGSVDRGPLPRGFFVGNAPTVKELLSLRLDRPDASPDQPTLQPASEAEAKENDSEIFLVRGEGDWQEPNPQGPEDDSDDSSPSSSDEGSVSGADGGSSAGEVSSSEEASPKLTQEEKASSSASGEANEPEEETRFSEEAFSSPQKGSRPRLSAAARRKMKKSAGGRLLSDGSRNAPSVKDSPSSPEKAPLSGDENGAQTQKPPKGAAAQLPRGKRSKMKRAKKKYADQDDEERRARMEVLASAVSPSLLLLLLSLFSRFLRSLPRSAKRRDGARF